MRFEFATATRIIFGPGSAAEFGALAASLGQRALLVTARNPSSGETTLDRLAADGYDMPAMLGQHAVAWHLFTVAGEPTLADARAGVQAANDAACDLVIGIGGGSAMDTAKAIAALVANPGDVLDYVEIIGRGKPLIVRPLPCMLVPTTAGTGAEVTRNAVLGAPEQHVKVSLRSPLMLPSLALIDAQLTYHVRPEVTASTGMDALTQLIEAFVSRRATPLTDALCRDGIPRAAQALPRAYADGRDTAAREAMALASMYSGLALANAGLGAAHGFAGPLGGMIAVPHGVACARLLAPVMAANLHALTSREPQNPAIARFDEVAQMLLGTASATATDGIRWLQETVAALEIPALARYGLRPDHGPELVARAAKASSMHGNPIALDASEMAAVVAQITTA